jgi:O-antigen/teichoic acid export membrane protein
MNTTQTIAKNTSILFLSQIISYLFGFFTIMYSARYLGPENYGILSLALALTGIFGILVDLGLSNLIVREISRDKSLSNKYLTNTSIMKFFLGLMTIVLIIITLKIVGYPPEVSNVIYIITASVIISSFSAIFNSIFQAHEKMEYLAIATILNSLLMFVGVIFAISKGYTIFIFAYLYFVISLIILFYNLIIYNWKFPSLKMEINFGFWKPTFKEALPFGLSGFFVTIYYWIDSVMLSLMVNNEVVGWYNAAYRIIMVFLFIPIVINTAIFPAMSKFYISSKQSLRIAYEKYFNYMIIIGIPLGIGTTLLANRVILLIYGTEYINSIPALQILVWSSVMIFISGSFGRLFEASNKQSIITKITAICAVGNILLNLILIPQFSYIGASIVTVITELAALILGIKAVSGIGYGLRRKEILLILKVILASVVMGLFIKYLKDLNLFILTVLSVIVYFVALYLLKGFDEEDIKIIKDIINLKR